MNQIGRSATDTVFEALITIFFAYIGLKIFEVLFPNGLGTLIGIILIIIVLYTTYTKLRG